MDASEFDEALEKALRLCRLAADLRLPTGEMLDYLAGALDIAGEAPPDTGFSGALGRAVADLEALREIIAAVGEIAAIGAGLERSEAAAGPPQKRPAPAPEPPQNRPFPMPANLREG